MRDLRAARSHRDRDPLARVGLELHAGPGHQRLDGAADHGALLGVPPVHEPLGDRPQARLRRHVQEVVGGRRPDDDPGHHPGLGSQTERARPDRHQRRVHALLLELAVPHRAQLLRVHQLRAGHAPRQHLRVKDGGDLRAEGVAVVVPQRAFAHRRLRAARPDGTAVEGRDLVVRLPGRDVVGNLLQRVREARLRPLLPLLAELLRPAYGHVESPSSRLPLGPRPRSRARAGPTTTLSRLGARAPDRECRYRDGSGAAGGNGATGTTGTTGGSGSTPTAGQAER